MRQYEPRLARKCALGVRQHAASILCAHRRASTLHILQIAREKSAGFRPGVGGDVARAGTPVSSLFFDGSSANDRLALADNHGVTPSHDPTRA